MRDGLQRALSATRFDSAYWLRYCPSPIFLLSEEGAISPEGGEEEDGPGSMLR